MLSRSFRRMAVAAGALALAWPAMADTPTINTYAGWDKSTAISQFGCTNTTTYGEVITVPDGLHHLNKFSFWWQNYTTGGAMVVRAYVYRWDAVNNAVQYAARFESLPRTIAYNDSLFHEESFSPGIAVIPGVQYVIFASIDREYVDCTNNYRLRWGFIQSDVYPGGGFVFQNNTGDDLQWTNAWSGFDDLAFKAYLSP